MNPISLRSISPDDWLIILIWLKRPHLAETSNTPALKSFKKLGFQPFRDFEENGENYTYLTKGSKITTLKR
jgi:hypothetical protein